MNWTIKFIDQAEQLSAVEDLQREVWPGSETDIVPLHVLVTSAHNGGLILGGYASGDSDGLIGNLIGSLIGFVYGFPGLYTTPDGPRPKHCSHMLGVHPSARDQGLGFALKRAQWQMVRHQGLDRITWTFDPLLSRNAYLNIARLGAVCSTYLPNLYGEMRDGMNAGLPSDRFQVDWWVNSKRVNRRLSKRPRLPLDLAHCLSAGAEILNPTQTAGSAWPVPPSNDIPIPGSGGQQDNLVLVEVPADFLALKQAEPALALEWRLHTRRLFEGLFAAGYLITDFVHLSGSSPRSFYVLSHGESTL